VTTVLIIDDHPIVLQGCRRVLQEAGIDPIFEARDVDAGLELYRRQRPDVTMVDLAINGGGLAGLALIRTVRDSDPRARILVFSMHGDAAIVARALAAGATGYLLKDTSPDEMVAAVRKVAAGIPHLSEALAVQVALAGTGAARSPLATLTPRELETLSLLARGMSYALIAEELGVSYKTVVNVSYQLKQKLDVRTLPELIRACVQLLPAAS
jgi:two-component system, NarL family, invasion response regulator UvrY